MSVSYLASLQIHERPSPGLVNLEHGKVAKAP